MPLDFLTLLQGNRIPLFLAPQAGVSEAPFRRLCREYGADVVVSEFVSSDGICRGNEKTHKYLRFEDDERPIGIQIFGSDPVVMADAAAQLSETYAPDFVDINFGCPVKKVVKRNGGSGCLQDLDLVSEITRSVVDATNLPVTAKTRSGFDENRRDPVGIGILEIPVVGNGDIRTGPDARRMWEETGCQGIMMARGTHGAPWLFTQARAALEGRPIPTSPDVPERFRVCLRHARNAIAFGGEPRRAAVEFRKHLGWYTKGVPGGKRLREELFQVTSLEEMKEILSSYLEEVRESVASA
jgi:tRNA-dihydrouridine synthase